mmetsp:Transcript_49041/g.36111  ORF Transcript_49041/g.36111 Transcript_49041/m.36111 type:complete len:112 (-) Transcript_49041:156-491(-)
MVFAAGASFFVSLIWFKEINPERREIFLETKLNDPRTQKKEQEIRTRVEQYTISGYFEWETLKNAEADDIVLLTTKLVFLAICSLYALLLTSLGLVMTSQSITTTLYLSSP